MANYEANVNNPASTENLPTLFFSFLFYYVPNAYSISVALRNRVREEYQREKKKKKRDNGTWNSPLVLDPVSTFGPIGYTNNLKPYPMWNTLFWYIGQKFLVYWFRHHIHNLLSKVESWNAIYYIWNSAIFSVPDLIYCPLWTVS